MKRASSMVWFLAWSCFLISGGRLVGAPGVSTLKAPDGGYRPQVVLDARGTLHLVYTRPTARGDLFYIRRARSQDEFSEPIRVNSTPRCAAAFNIAVGKGGRVHVLIRPNAVYSRNKLKRKPVFNDLKYMLYCRLNDGGTRFEEERDLSGETFGFEGVGALLADGKGTVRAYWHGLSRPGRENTRRVFVATSIDEGKTFSLPAAIEVGVEGACACCPMHGSMDHRGNFYLGFRNSEASLTKDAYLLTSTDGGKTFRSSLLGAWANAGCPGATFSLSSGPSGVCVAWQTESQVFFSRGNVEVDRVAAPTLGKTSRSPVVVTNSRDEVLFAWSEAASPREFRMGGDLAWVIYDKKGKAISKKQVVPAAVARWSSPAAYAEPDGDFVIFHDGPGRRR